MLKLNRPRLLFFTALCLATAGVSALLLNSDRAAVRAIDSLFIGSLPALTVGLFLCAKNLGMFDLPIYGFKLLRRYTKNFADELGQRSFSYHEYTESIGPDPRWKEPLAVGAVLMLLSVALTAAFA